MANATLLDDGYPQNLDFVMDMRIRVGLGTTTVLILIFNCISLVALIRTSHTPKTARFLAIALLMFDVSALSMYTIRKAIEDGRYNLLIQILAMGWNFVAYVDIGIMSVERLVVIQWPNYYLRRFSFSKFRTFTLALWIFLLLFYFAYIVGCFVDNYAEVDIRACFDPMIYNYIQFTVLTSGIISCLCLGRIFFLIRLHRNKSTALPKYKSTIVVFLCCLNYMVTAFFYAVVLFFTLKKNYKRRISIDIVMCLNGLADSCVYVWWYKECRLEILKILSVMFPTLKSRIEKMRMEIFDIITYTSEAKMSTSQLNPELRAICVQQVTTSRA